MFKRILPVFLGFCLLIFLAAPALAEDHFFSVMLLGIDEKGLSDTEKSEAGRADAIMVASVNPTNGEIALASIDRDTATEISSAYTTAPGINKLCVTAFFGGPELTLASVNSLFDLHIEYYMAIDKEGLRKVVDLMGGLDLEITKEERKEMPQLFRSAGQKHLSGKSILEYAGWRDFDAGPSSDIARTERQRKVLSACMQKAQAMGFAKLAELAPQMLPYVQTNIDVAGALLLAGSFLNNPDVQLKEMRFPQDANRKVVNLHNVLLPTDWAKESQDLNAFLYPQP
ncbi:MAG: LCP family protein [Clostridia bacterium]